MYFIRLFFIDNLKNVDKCFETPILISLNKENPRYNLYLYQPQR